MSAWLTHPFARLAAALLAWIGLGGLGWWWHRPAPLVQPAAAAAQPPAPPALLGMADLSRDPLASRLQAQDPFALQRTASTPAGTATAGTPGGDDIVWRFAALTENHGQRQLLLTATDQPPQLLKAGDKLPNGERIKSIDATSVLLQDAKGRKRTIQLIEP